MNDVLEVFDGIKNVEFTELTYVKELDRELPAFTLTDIPAERWNAMAAKANTKAFIDEFNRQPKDYDEVRTWIYSLIGEERPKPVIDVKSFKDKIKNHIAANEMAF